MDAMGFVGVLIGLAVGGALGALIMKLWVQAHTPDGDEALRVELATLQSEHQATLEKVQWMATAEEKLREAFESLAGQSLRHNADAFLKQAQEQMTGVLNQVRGDWKTQKAEMTNLIHPMKENLTALDGHVRELEQKREGAYQELGQQLRNLGEAQVQLQQTTTTLSQALKSSSVRGQWGEVQLRRVVELSGMERHVAFAEQQTGDSGRPDMVIYLPGGGELPVDAKAPMASYLTAVEAEDEAAYHTGMKEHAKAVQSRVRDLGQKAYWAQFENAPEFVVMFVPVEASVAAAFEADPNLLDDALQRKVLIATPVTLLALLKAVAYGWQQHAVSENARKIADEGRELYGRLSKFAEHLGTVGNRLNQTVASYNSAVGSLERRVMPSVRRFEDLEVASAEMDAPQLVEAQARGVAMVED